MREAQRDSIGAVSGRSPRPHSTLRGGVVVLAMSLVVGAAAFAVYMMWPLAFRNAVGTVGQVQRFVVDLPKMDVDAALSRIGQEAHVTIAPYRRSDAVREQTIGFQEVTSAYHAAQIVLFETRREVVPPPNGSATELDIVYRTSPVPDACRHALISPDSLPVLSESEAFNIPAVSMDVGLTCWSMQSGIPAYVHRKKGVRPLEVRDALATLTSPEVKGHMSALDALERLIADAHGGEPGDLEMAFWGEFPRNDATIVDLWLGRVGEFEKDDGGSGPSSAE